MNPTGPSWPSRRRARGLSLIEVLVTLFLASVAFGLIFVLAQAQARVARQQQEMERFLVDADACFSLLESDLATAFAVSPSGASHLIEIAHLMRDSAVDEGAAPFNSEPFTPSSHGGGAPLLPDFRGTPLRTVYALSENRLTRSSSELLPPNAALSELPVLDGVNSALATVSGPMVELRLTFLSQTRAQTVQRNIFAPGLATR